MSRPFSVIGAIVKKDALSLWPVAGASAALVVGWGLLSAASHHDRRYVEIAAFLEAVAVLGSFVLLSSIVHQDAAVGPRHDWRTRPVGRLDLMVAKHLFVIPAVLLPWLIALVINDLSLGETWGEVIGERATTYSVILLTPAAIAFVGTTETLLGLIVMLSVCLVSAIGFNVALSALFRASVTSGASEVQTWMEALIVTGLYVIGGVLLLWAEFGKQRPRLAAGAIVLICLFGPVLAGSLIPFGPAWAMEKLKGGETQASRGISASATVQCRVPAFTEHNSPYHLVGAAGFNGVPQGARLNVEHVDGDYLDNAGKTLRHPPLIWGLGSPTTSAAGDGSISRAFSVADQNYARPMQVPTLRLRYALTLLQPLAEYDAPVDGKRHVIAGFGYCSFTANPKNSSGATIGYNCLRPGVQPDLIEISSPQEPDLVCGGCQPDYTPAVFEIPGGRRYTGWVVAPIGKAPPTTVRITTYRATARFDREAQVEALDTATLPACSGTPSENAIPAPED